MASPQTKTFKVTAGYTYSYTHIAPQDSAKPTFLLVHGFPNCADDWKNQVKDLSAAGYGVLVPDLLGYGGTDKPEAVEEYKMSKMTAHIVDILEHEGLKKVVGVGHDWGCGLLSKLVNFYPSYFSALAFLSVPYSPGLSDIDGLNARTEAAFGYPAFGYQLFFNEDDAAEIIDRNIESFTSVVFPADPSIWRTNLCPYGKAKEWLLAGTISPDLPSYETPATREARIARFKSGGLTAPLNWYKASLRNVDAEAINAIPKQNLVLNVPTVLLGGDKDDATRVEMMQMAAAKMKEAGLLKQDVEVKVVEGASHWVTLERPDEVFKVLEELVKKVL